MSLAFQPCAPCKRTPTTASPRPPHFCAFHALLRRCASTCTSPTTTLTPPLCACCPHAQGALTLQVLGNFKNVVAAGASIAVFNNPGRSSQPAAYSGTWGVGGRAGGRAGGREGGWVPLCVIRARTACLGAHCLRAVHGRWGLTGGGGDCGVALRHCWVLAL